METKEMALTAAKELDKKNGADIRILDVAEKSSFTDYLIIASGGSMRQTSALADAVEDKMAEEGIDLVHSEGRRDTGWILLDYGDIVVNVFTEEMREKYNLEKVWADCDEVPFEQE
ncbi:MAG: ribosome silencing factor [Anaerovoracaceae bacterium]|jgi:ribosome-associated protein